LNSLRGILLTAGLFVVAATALRWNWLDWDSARDHLLPTLLLSPVIWSVAVGRTHPPSVRRGIAAGAITGLLTQMLPHVPMLWRLLSQPAGDSQDHAIATATVAIHLMIGAGALMVGALVGLVSTVLEHRAQLSN
jgi:hypothetical protein